MLDQQKVEFHLTRHGVTVILWGFLWMKGMKGVSFHYLEIFQLFPIPRALITRSLLIQLIRIEKELLELWCTYSFQHMVSIIDWWLDWRWFERHQTRTNWLPAKRCLSHHIDGERAPGWICFLTWIPACIYECDPSVFGYPFLLFWGCYSPSAFVIFLCHHRASEGFMERPFSRDCVVRIPGIWCDVRDTCPLMATRLAQFWEGVPLVRTLTSMADLFLGITYWVIAIKDQWISGISHSWIDAPSLPFRRTGSGLTIHVLDPLFLGKYVCRSCHVLVLMS